MRRHLDSTFPMNKIVDLVHARHWNASLLLEREGMSRRVQFHRRTFARSRGSVYAWTFSARCVSTG